MTTQRRKYRKYFEACLLVLGPIPPIMSLKDIREQDVYKTEAMAWWRATQNDQCTEKACHRFWKAYRLWHIEIVGPIRLKYKSGAHYKNSPLDYRGTVTGRWPSHAHPWQSINRLARYAK